MDPSSFSVTLCGFMGSGKTTIGRPLADRLGYVFADTDEMLIRRTGMTIPQLFEKGGEAYFRLRERETVREAARLERTVISTGGGVMTFEENASLLAAHSVVVFIDRSFDDCYAFLACQSNRPIVQRHTREELHAMYQARVSAYRKYASLTVPNTGSVEEAVQWILDRLPHPGQPASSCIL